MAREQVFVLQASHNIVPGIHTTVHRTMAGAEAKAARLKSTFQNKVDTWIIEADIEE